ncbi:MAG: hypothetical protein MUO40_02590 [Anaerolineaceae bacterium]|nr:hypothetical protein [Anaerolineaceae bacterium]
MKRIHKPILLMLGLFIGLSMACSLPFGAQDDFVAKQTEAQILASEDGFVPYMNRGVQIYLPYTYVLGEVEQDIPGLESILQMLAGTTVNSNVQSLIDSLINDVMMWGTNQNGDLSNRTRILILRNEKMAKLPLALVSVIDPSILGDKLGTIEQTKLDLAGREVLRLTAIQGTNAEAVYMLKDSDSLWFIAFFTTNNYLLPNLINFEKSVATFQVISVEQ